MGLSSTGCTTTQGQKSLTSNTIIRYNAYFENTPCNRSIRLIFSDTMMTHKPIRTANMSNHSKAEHSGIGFEILGFADAEAELAKMHTEFISVLRSTIKPPAETTQSDQSGTEVEVN